MGDIQAAGLLVGVFALIVWCPSRFCYGLLTIGSEDMTLAKKILCWIPVYNIIKAETHYWGKIYFAGWGELALIASTIIKVCTWYFLNGMRTLNLVTSILILAVFVLVFFLSMVDVYVVLKDTNAMTSGKHILFSVLFPFGMYFIGNYLPNVVSKRQRAEDAFKQ